MKKPNILFIMCDQMRWDALRCNGNDNIETPHLDRLAASGVNFTNSLTPNPICIPARASLTTGCYPHKCTGIKENNGTIKDGFPLLGEEMDRRDYETYVAGKLHYSPYSPPGEKRTTHGLKTVELAESGRILSKFDPEGKLSGLEDYHDYLHTVGWGGYERGHGMGNNDVYPAASPIPQEHYVDTWVADRSLDMMKHHLEQKSDKPFFMWTSFPKPHSAFDPPRPYDEMYDPRDMPAPTGNMGILKDRGLDQFVQNHYKYIWDKLSPASQKVIKAFYYGLISHQDHQVGKLLDFLDAQGLKENTIVVFTSDHGEMLGDFGMYFKKNFYNGSVRVPLMISWPGTIKPQKSDELVGLQDLLPTLLSLTGTPLEQEVDGKDLSCQLLGGTNEQSASIRDYYIAQCGDDPQQQYMVLDKTWKFIYNQRGSVEELYHQQEDVAELNNLADYNDPAIQTVKDQMKQYLIDWCRENGDEGMLDGDVLKVLECVPNFEMPTRDLPFGRRFY